MRSHVCVMVVAFDTLVASKQLQAAGVPESQADAIVTTLARGFGDNVATKDDLQIAVAKIEGKINELRGEMHGADRLDARNAPRRDQRRHRDHRGRGLEASGSESRLPLTPEPLCTRRHVAASV